MLKKALLSLGILSLVAAFAPAPASAVEELNFVCLTNDAHANTRNAIIPWIEEVSKRTNGELEIIRHNVNTLNPVRENFTATVQGFLDIGSNTIADNPGLFPLYNVLQLPLITYSSRCTGYAANELTKKYKVVADQLKDIHLLFLWASPEFILNTNKPVRKLEDLKGMRILVWDTYMQNIVAALGANPIMVPALDTYLSLSRGMADGVVASSATLVSWKIGEVTKYHTRVTLTGNLFWCGMNKDRWDSLSDEHKKVLTETAATMTDKCCTVTDAAAHEELKYCADQGHEVIYLSDEELARWKKQLAPLYDTWLADMAKLGIKEAPAILEDAKALTKKRYEELVAAGTF